MEALPSLQHSTSQRVASRTKLIFRLVPQGGSCYPQLEALRHEPAAQAGAHGPGPLQAAPGGLLRRGLLRGHGGLRGAGGAAAEPLRLQRGHLLPGGGAVLAPLPEGPQRRWVLACFSPQRGGAQMGLFEGSRYIF